MTYKILAFVSSLLLFSACGGGGGGNGEIPVLTTGDPDSGTTKNVAAASAGGSATSFNNVSAASIVNGVLYPNEGNPWMTSTNNASVVVRLASEAAVSSIVINARLPLLQGAIFPIRYLSLEQSSDNSVWNQVNCNFSGSSGSSSRSCVLDRPVNTRFIRVTFNDNGIGSHSLFRLYEVQVLGIASR